MELLEYTAKQLHFYLSDFHYIEKLMEAKELLYKQIEIYSLEEWICAYEYIFHEDTHQAFSTALEVYEAIYDEVRKKGTPLDPIKHKKKESRKYKLSSRLGR